MARIKSALSLSTMVMLLAAPVGASQFSGQINLEHRQFFDAGLYDADQAQTSIVLQPEWSTDWNDGDSQFTAELFGRYDSIDDERSHADIRELMYLTVFDDYEFQAGIGKVFWGVTESVHLVDVINQTDAVESVDGEQKLGQPMVSVAAIKEWGTVRAWLLPYFRERTFAGTDGRLRAPFGVSKHATYESSHEEHHIDAAFRYSHYFGDWDIGISYFKGTNREPYLRFNGNELVPHYALMDQFSLDLQGVFGSWLWKWEALYRDSLDHHFASIAGFEYTLVGISGTQWDLGLIAEYQYDSRDENSPSPAQNDIFLGTRLAINDADGTEILAGIAQDFDHSGSYSGKIEASARINNSWKWRANAWVFNSDTAIDPLYSYRDEDFIELALEWYY